MANLGELVHYNSLKALPNCIFPMPCDLCTPYVLQRKYKLIPYSVLYAGGASCTDARVPDGVSPCFRGLALRPGAAATNGVIGACDDVLASRSFDMDVWV